ncbi:hypothetical protein PV327_003078 [Microctonus hyperodae]|nr:hypothetical protein PV327_003078 [Microctonus hyperodae]
MDRRDFVLATIFGTFGVLGILIGLGLAAWFYFRSKRPKRSAGDCEDSMDNGENSSQKLTKKNGFLNLKTPLIKSIHANQICLIGGHVHRQYGAKRKCRTNPLQFGIRLPKHNAHFAYYSDLLQHKTTPIFSSNNICHLIIATQRTKIQIMIKQNMPVDKGKDLPAKDLSGTSDPYVRVTLLPDKKHRLETKIKRRTLNPRWNETLYFEGFPIQKLQSRVLHLHVFDYDRFSRDDSIGEMFLPLCQVDFSEKPSFWKALKPPAKDKCGELLCSLCYHPSNSVLTLTLLKARNLKAKDINGKSDPYVKVWLQFGDKRIEKRKTPIFKCTLNPVFNEAFSFNVPWEKIRECSLDVMVMDFDNIGRNELIGRIQLAGKNGSGASETKHWQDMITKPRQTIVTWHRLKPE